MQHEGIYKPPVEEQFAECLNSYLLMDIPSSIEEQQPLKIFISPVDEHPADIPSSPVKNSQLTPLVSS
jgi:hypothetical protein